jgi:hypothetical protein
MGGSEQQPLQRPKPSDYTEFWGKDYSEGTRLPKAKPPRQASTYDYWEQSSDSTEKIKPN